MYLPFLSIDEIEEKTIYFNERGSRHSVALITKNNLVLRGIDFL